MLYNITLELDEEWDLLLLALGMLLMLIWAGCFYRASCNSKELSRVGLVSDLVMKM